MAGASSSLEAGQPGVGGLRGHVQQSRAHGWRGEHGGAHAERALWRLSCHRAARVRSEDRPMGDLVARRPLSFRSPRPAGQRPLRQRRWNFLFRRHYRREASPHPGHLFAYHANIRALGTGLFARNRKDVGNELDHDIHARQVAIAYKNTAKMNEKTTTTIKTYLLWRGSLLALLFLVIKVVPLALGQQENDKKPSAPPIS